VPNRFTYGYGLSPDIVDLAATKKPDLIVTVDNGIASVDGVARARAARHRHADHRSPPAGRRTAGGRLHRQPQSARLRASRARHWPASV
jgi:hypothetical protein